MYNLLILSPPNFNKLYNGEKINIDSSIDTGEDYFFTNGLEKVIAGFGVLGASDLVKG